MIRRFALAPILFLALWSLWFIVPTTRGAARAAWQTVWSQPDATTPYAMTPSKPLSGTSRDALVGRALSAGDAIAGNKEKAKALETLRPKFPGDAAICAGQLVYGADQLELRWVRQPGPASNPDVNWSVKLSKIKRPSPRFLKSWFAATSRGAQLEPQNTFWDWMQILGLLAARRDGEVWPVLRAAKSKTGFDDHTNDLAATLIREQRKEHGPLPPLSEVNLAFTNSFSVLAPMREAARQLSEDAYGLRLQKTAQSDQQALEGMRDLVFLSRTFRRESKAFISSITGQALESVALWGGGFTPSNAKRGRSLPGAKTLPRYASDWRSLLFFARSQKRGDVAAQLSIEWVALGTWRAKTRRAFLTTGMEGMNPRDFTLASAGDWLGWRLLAGIPCALGLAALSAIPLRLIPALRRERDVPTRAASAWGVILSALSFLFLISSMLWIVGAFWKATGVAPLNVGFTLIYDPLSLTTDTDIFSGAPRSWSLAFPASFLFVCALWFAASWDAKRRKRATLGARLKEVLRAPDDGLSRFDVAPVLGLIGVVSALCAGSGATLAFLILPVLNPDYASVHVHAVWVLLGLSFVMALPAWWRLRGWAGRAFALRLAGRFAWAFAISASLGWGVLTLATAPAHRRFEAQLDRYLQVGEFQLARKRLGI